MCYLILSGGYLLTCAVYGDIGRHLASLESGTDQVVLYSVEQEEY